LKRGNGRKGEPLGSIGSGENGSGIVGRWCKWTVLFFGLNRPKIYH
jgi:hypothetical protein